MTDHTDEIYSFFTTIFQDQEGNVVCGLMDRAGPRGQLTIQKDFRYPEHLEDMVEWVTQFQSQDVYVSPIIYGDMKKTTKGGAVLTRRIPENAISTHVVYQDSDTCPPDKFRLSPSVHVESSAGRYQDYWLLTDSVAASRAADASRRIAIAHRQDGSDPSSWSMNKYLRVPFTTNTRHGFPEEVTVSTAGTMYTIEEIEDKYADVEFEERAIMRLPEDVSYDDVQDLPEYAGALAKLPGTFKMSLITDQPSPTQDRSTLRYRLLCDLFRVPGLEFEEVLAIAWHAPASQKWREDPRNLRGLIGEALKAQADVAFRTGESVEGVQPSELLVKTEQKPRPKVSLLTDQERTLAEGERDFIKEYEAWSQVKLGAAHNGPYARMNAWSLLSAAFSDFGVLPTTGDALNLFQIALGGSGSGKSSARRLWKRSCSEVFEHDKGWFLGSDASPVALHEKLIERDGKVSIFAAEEAHGFFKATNSQQWADGIYEKMAEYYNGEVPPILRVSQGRKDTSGKTAKTYFGIHFVGTLKGEMSLPSQLTTSMFHTGFLARFNWWIGEEKEVNEESLKETNGDGGYANLGYEAQARQWAAEFANTKKILKAKTGRTQVAMPMAQGALDRLTALKIQARDLAMKRAEWDILEPSLIRFSESVRKAASLLALVEGRAEVTLRDLVVAMVTAEEWLANLFYIAEQISASMWAREVDEIEAFIMAKGGEVQRQVVFRKFASRQNRILEQQIEALQAQARVIVAEQNGKQVLRLVSSQES